MKKSPKGPALSQGEWEILKVVWERQPCTAPDVQEALSQRTGWSYSTVRTMMDRLVKKGALQAEKVRNLTLFRAAVKRDQARKREFLDFLKCAFDGALAPMVELLLEHPDLDPEELDRIERLIERKKRAKKTAGGRKSRRKKGKEGDPAP